MRMAIMWAILILLIILGKHVRKNRFFDAAFVVEGKDSMEFAYKNLIYEIKR